MTNIVENEAENQAWRDKSNDLAQWAIAHLYARTDAYPEWIGQQWFCKKEPVTADHLAYHFRGLWTVGTYTIKPTEDTCVYTAWDIDCHDLTADPDANWRTAETLYHRLFALGLRPILEDSNGDGGYHVWVLWSEPLPAAVALSFGRWIVQDAGVPVEVFPKQPSVGNGYGNQIRVPGHHHKRNHWSRFWDGGFEWLENEDAVQLLLTHRPVSPERIPRRARSYVVPMAAAPQRPGQGADLDAGDEWWRQYDGSLRTLDILELCGDRLTGKVSGGWHEVVCPWADAHTDGNDMAYVREADEDKFPSYFCHHHHCEEKRLGDLLALYEPARVNDCCAEHFGCNGHERDAEIEAIIKSAPLDGRQKEPMGLGSVDKALYLATATVPVMPTASNGQTTDFIQEIAQAEAKLEKSKMEKLPAWAVGISAADLDAEDIPIEYLVDRLLAAMPTVIGGRFKTLKTLIMVDLMVSMSSGTKFLGRWQCKRVRVGVWSGESGRVALQNAMRRVCKARGIKPSDCALDWHFSLPPLYSRKDLDFMEGLIRQKEYKAIFIDPAYLCLLDSGTASKAGNVFVMGAALQPLTEVGQKTGCLVGLVHHFGKWTDSNNFTPAELGELSQAGMAEWPRQWLLLSRRSPYMYDGKHSLYMTAGGSLGQAYQLAIDIDEGDLSKIGLRTEWKVEVKPINQASADDKIARKEKRGTEGRDKIMKALLAESPLTRKGLCEATGLRQDKHFNDLLQVLLDEGKIVAAKWKNKQNKDTEGVALP